ncbi:hypothetical protein HSBAA_PA_1890 (plasmid) [Vreelandella sulfidaeris]|uniref:Uncharacterized protein n=1 Tax=Vreelandella sulfidaeris TaxID=115553 RepID=A0A455UH48_9GAMM|nr:hypothetical protein HSBAA_PA_1890 [Halomonas sulfidaeris]
MSHYVRIRPMHDEVQRQKGEATEQSDATNVQARVEDASEVNAGTAPTTRQLVDQSESIKQSSSKFQA